MSVDHAIQSLPQSEIGGRYSEHQELPLKRGDSGDHRHDAQESHHLHWHELF